MNFLRKLFGQSNNGELPTTTTIYAFFVRAKGKEFEKIIDTATYQGWTDRIRTDTNMPDAHVILIQENDWNPPILNSPTPDEIIRKASKIIKSIKQKFVSLGISLTILDGLELSPIGPMVISTPFGMVIFIVPYTK